MTGEPPAAGSAPSGEACLRAATRTARDLGLDVRQPVVLRAGSNALVHLAPAPVVARVARLTSLARPRPEQALGREVHLARALAARGAPVLPPTAHVDPGPHAAEGLHLTLWPLLPGAVPVTGGPRVAGASLAAVHDAAAGLPVGELPGLAELVADATRALDAGVRWLAADARLGLEPLGERARALAAAVDSGAAGAPRVLHGDAHPGNLLTPRGPGGAGGVLWTDLEDAVAGPLEWDLAVMARSAAHDGAAALAAHEAATSRRADPDLLAAMGWLRAWQGACWRVLSAAEDPARRPGAASAVAGVPTDVPGGLTA